MRRGAAVAMAEILTKETGWPWRVTGGWDAVAHGWEDHVFAVSVPGGMLDAGGIWRSPYWATSECDPDDPDAPCTYVDALADQFGHPARVVTPEGDPRYRANLCPMGMDLEIGSGALRHGREWADWFNDVRERERAPAPGMA